MLNVNGLSTSMEVQILLGLISKTHLYSAYEKHFKCKNTNKMKVKRIEYCLQTPKESWCGCINLVQNSCRTRCIIRSKEEYVIISGSIHQEDIIILNVCLTNNTAFECRS